MRRLGGSRWAATNGRSTFADAGSVAGSQLGHGVAGQKFRSARDFADLGDDQKVHRPLPVIARELGVDGILEGSVGRTANRVHINIQLIFAPTDTHLWAESYDRDLGDVISLQSELAQTIARQVGVTASTSPRLEKRISPEAHDAYLLGSYYWFVDDGSERSRQDFQKAINSQPDYAAAWSGLADSYLGSAAGGEARPDEMLPQGDRLPGKQWS